MLETKVAARVRSPWVGTNVCNLILFFEIHISFIHSSKRVTPRTFTTAPASFSTPQCVRPRPFGSHASLLAYRRHTTHWAHRSLHLVHPTQPFRRVRAPPNYMDVTLSRYLMPLSLTHPPPPAPVSTPSLVRFRSDACHNTSAPSTSCSPQHLNPHNGPPRSATSNASWTTTASPSPSVLTPPRTSSNSAATSRRCRGLTSRRASSTRCAASASLRSASRTPSGASTPSRCVT